MTSKLKPSVMALVASLVAAKIEIVDCLITIWSSNNAKNRKHIDNIISPSREEKN